MDFVWDYGTLNAGDERNYIHAIMGATFPGMTGSEHRTLVEAVAASQKCIYNYQFILDFN